MVKIKSKEVLAAFLLGVGLFFLPTLCVGKDAGVNTLFSEILLQEDFDDGIAQGFGNEIGDWKVIDGKYTATRGVSRFSTICDLDWTDYSLEADFIKAKDGGFLIRAQNDDNGIVLVVRPSHNDIYWAEVCWTEGKTRGWGARYEVRALGHKPGQNLYVKVEVIGDEFKAYVNGEIKTVFKSAEFPEPKVALYLYRQSGQYWDNVVVRNLTNESR
jgi:hypothetical protein